MDDFARSFTSGFELAAEREKLAADHSETALRAFFNILRKASYIVPCKEENREELCVLTGSDGVSLLPLFTSFAEYDKWPFERGGTSILPYDRLKTIALEQPEKLGGLVIDAFSKSALRLGMAQLREIDSVTTGFSFEKSAPRGEVSFHPPFILFPPLTAALTELFDGFETVYKAFLLLAQPKNELVPHLLVLIDFTGDRSVLFPKITQVLRPYLSRGDRFEIMKADFKSLSAAERVTRPVYERR